MPQPNFGLGTRELYLAERRPGERRPASHAPGTDRTLAQLEEQSTQKVNKASVPQHSAQGHSVEQDGITLLNTPESNWRWSSTKATHRDQANRGCGAEGARRDVEARRVGGHGSTAQCAALPSHEGSKSLRPLRGVETHSTAGAPPEVFRVSTSHQRETFRRKHSPGQGRTRNIPERGGSSCMRCLHWTLLPAPISRGTWTSRVSYTCGPHGLLSLIACADHHTRQLHVEGTGGRVARSTFGTSRHWEITFWESASDTECWSGELNGQEVHPIDKFPQIAPPTHRPSLQGPVLFRRKETDHRRRRCASEEDNQDGSQRKVFPQCRRCPDVLGMFDGADLLQRTVSSQPVTCVRDLSRTTQNRETLRQGTARSIGGSL